MKNALQIQPMTYNALQSGALIIESDLQFTEKSFFALDQRLTGDKLPFVISDFLDEHQWRGYSSEGLSYIGSGGTLN